MWCGSTYPTLVNNTKSTVLVTERQIVSICPTNEAGDSSISLACYILFARNIEYPSGMAFCSSPLLEILGFIDYLVKFVEDGLLQVTKERLGVLEWGGPRRPGRYVILK